MSQFNHSHTNKITEKQIRAEPSEKREVETDNEAKTFEGTQQGHIEDELKEIQGQMKISIEPFARFGESIFKASRIVGDAIFRLDTIIKSINLPEKFANLQENIKKLENSTIRIKAIMLEIGFPPHGSFPILDITRIVEIYDLKGIEYTKRLLERYFSQFVYREEELINMQKLWLQASWLDKRMKIINAALAGHLNGYYDLTVPTLLAQLEGILVDAILTFDDILPGEKISYKRQKSFLGLVILGDTDTFSFDEQIEQIYTTIILAEFERGKEINSCLSRHAILHGEDTVYGTKLNSLKAILIFDYFFEKINELYKDIDVSRSEVQEINRKK